MTEEKPQRCVRCSDVHRAHEGTEQGTLPQAVLGVGVSGKAAFLWASGSWSATWPGGLCEIVCFPVLNLNKVWGCPMKMQGKHKTDSSLPGAESLTGKRTPYFRASREKSKAFCPSELCYMMYTYKNSERSKMSKEKEL